LRYDFNPLDWFKSMDVFWLDNLTTEGLRKFLVRNFFSPSETDLSNAIKRLDLNRDFRVTYTEFKNLVSSYSSWVVYNYPYYPYYSYLEYSPIRKSYYYSPFRTRVYCSPRRCYSPLKYYYSPPKRIQPYSVLKSELNLSWNEKLNTSMNRTSSPLRSTGNTMKQTSDVLSRSPKRVNSPPRNNTRNEFNTTSNNLNVTNLSQNLSSSKYVGYEEEVF